MRLYEKKNQQDGSDDEGNESDLLGIEECDHENRSHIVGDRQRCEEDLQPDGNALAEDSQQAQSEGNVGSHRNAPTMGSFATAIEDGVDRGRNGDGDEEDVYAASRQQKNRGVDYPTDPTRSPQGTVLLAPMDPQREQAPPQHAAEVDHEQGSRAVDQLDTLGEAVEAEEIEEEMAQVRVEEGAGDAQ